MCERCGVERDMYALSDKPDPGYGYRSHTWEDCARNLLIKVTASASASPELRQRAEKLLREKGVNDLLAAASDFADTIRKHGPWSQ